MTEHLGVSTSLIPKTTTVTNVVTQTAGTVVSTVTQTVSGTRLVTSTQAQGVGESIVYSQNTC